MLRHVASLWGFPVRLEEIDERGQTRQIAETKIDRRRLPR
jgi:spore cortex formation protein SpoVR/YcgB (stage V sporulation)